MSNLVKQFTQNWRYRHVSLDNGSIRPSKSLFSFTVKTLLLINVRKKKLLKRCKYMQERCTIGKKNHDFSSLSVHISRLCANSAKFCPVARP